MTAHGERIIKHAVRTLRDHYMPKIREAVERLSEEQVWDREGEASNSVGNLLLHLAGNVRQHLIAGVSGKPDTRERPKEFAARGGPPKAELLARLEATVVEAAGVLEAFDPERLLEKRTIQGREVVLLDDVFAVVEHFAYHAGQIIFVAKARSGAGFPWYRHLDPK